MSTSGVNEKVHHVVEIPEKTHFETLSKEPQGTAKIDYSYRAQWLRAAVLGANDGLVSVSSLIMGVGAVNRDVRAMLLAGFAGLVAGASSMAIGEYVSVHTQLDIEVAQIKRDKGSSRNGENHAEEEEELEEGKEEEEGVDHDDQNQEKLPNPFQAALASAVSFSAGGLVPLLPAAFIQDYRVRVAVVAAVASLALMVFGGVGAALGRSRVGVSCVRVLVGGWIAMAVTFALTKLVKYSGMSML
ncbi:Ccc1-like protein [Parasponia andersonii]|uniref:Vacuolar iron transporter n=1 Tax=Parasponia andersonii TaxID=3476 RepID=A0A2P5D4B0_PARAD|nr:Ccc1-like protein [Parasponia andersonii]